MLYLIVYIAASLMGSLIASKYLSAEAVLCVCVILLFCLVFMLLVKTFRNFAVIICIVTMLIGFVGFSIKYEFSVKDVENLNDQLPVNVKAQINDMPSFKEGKYYYELDVISMTSGNLTVYPDCKIALYTKDKINAEYCSIVSFTDKMYFTGAQNSFAFGRGVYAHFYSDNISVTVIKENSFKKWILNAREYIYNYINQNLNFDAAGIVCGITLGDSSGVSDETSKNFMRCGGSHVMAVSGMHASLIAAMVMFVLLNFGIDRKIAISISVPIVFFFAIISGFNYSTIRSAIMFMIFAISIVVFRDYHDMTALGIAIIAILICDPFAVYDIGFLLSCSAVFGMCLINPIATGYLKKKKPFKNNRIKYKVFKFFFLSTVMSLTCTVFTFPVSSLYFSEVSIISPLTNILLVVLAEGVLLFSVVGVLFSLTSFFNPVGLVSIRIAGFIAVAIKEVVNTLGSFSFSAVNTGNKYLPLLVAAILLVFSVCIFMKIRLKNFLIASCISFICICVFVATFGILNYNKTEIFFLDTEKGVCIAVTKNKTASIICTGNDKNNFKLKSLLENKGISQIDCLYLPDLSEKQSAGAVDLIKSFNVSEVVIDDQKDGLYSSVVSVCDGLIPIRLIGDDQRYYGAYFTFLKNQTYSRVWVGQDSFCILFDEYEYKESDNYDVNIAVLSDAVVNVNGCGFDAAVVCGEYVNVAENCRNLSNNDVRCLMTNSKGNISAFVDKDGFIVLNEYYY